MVLGVHSSRMLGARNNKHAQMDSACVVLYECDERDLDGRRISRERSEGPKNKSRQLKAA